jgi:hypothetical protein
MECKSDGCVDIDDLCRAEDRPDESYPSRLRLLYMFIVPNNHEPEG